MLSVELVVTKVERRSKGLEWFKVYFDLSFLSLLVNDNAAVYDKTVLGTLVVVLQQLLSSSYGSEDRLTVHSTFDI